MLDYALRKAKEAADSYEMFAVGTGGNFVRKCEKQLLWYCELFNQLNIQVHYLPAGLPPIAMKGTFVNAGDHYDILLLPELPEPEKRFVFCKELFHIVLDDEMVHNMNLWSHIDQTIFGNFNGAPVPSNVLAEYATHAAAAEFFFPHEHRQKLFADGRTDWDAIAHEYGIPSQIVEHCMSASAIKFFAVPEG